MIEGAEGVGWGAIITISLSLATALLGYGASSQRNKRTAEDVAELKKDHAEQIRLTRDAASKAQSDLADYKLAATEKFVPRGDLQATEQRLSTAIASAKDDMVSKVEEIKAEIGKRQITHTISNAIAAELAKHQLAAKGKVQG